MSGIQKKLDSLQPYVISIRYIQGINVVDAVFKQGWTVPKSEYINIEKGDGDEEYYMFFSQKEGIGVDELLDYIEHVIKLNVERELKYELLKEKVKELKALFNKTSLEKLRTLKFKISDDLIPETMSEEDILLSEVDKYESREKTAESVQQELEEKRNYKPPTDEEMDAPIAESVNTNVKPVMHGDIELPPKGEKIELEEFEPVNGECNCGPNDICPNCADKKGF